MNIDVLNSYDYHINDRFKTSGDALDATTDLVLIAHPDDIEFMCPSAMQRCYQSNTDHLFGVVFTSGSGGNIGVHKLESQRALVNQRKHEQIEAMQLAGYSGLIFLDIESGDLRGGAKHDEVQLVLETLLTNIPDLKRVYTHQPFDKHKTHQAVFAEVESLINQLEESKRSSIQWLGGEVWGSLGLLPESLLIREGLDLADDRLVKIFGVFASQISVSKDYPNAVKGRCLANATFKDPYQETTFSGESIFLDLSLNYKPVLQALGQL